MTKRKRGSPYCYPSCPCLARHHELYRQICDYIPGKCDLEGLATMAYANAVCLARNYPDENVRLRAAIVMADLERRRLV